MMRLLPLILLLAACERTDHAPGPGAASIAEAKALGDAEAMLAVRDPPVAEPTPKAKESP